MAREAIPTWCFAIVVVRKEDRFLIVHERKRDQPWYLPAGRVEVGETFTEAACRETLEEAGIPVRLLGLIRIEHTPKKSATRMRVVFLAEPLDNTPPKSVPDNESLGAAWVSLEELSNYTLRGPDVRELFSYVQSNGAVYPLSVLQTEGQPYRH